MKKTTLILFSVIFIVILLSSVGGYIFLNNRVLKQAVLEKSVAIAGIIGIDVSMYSVSLDFYSKDLFLNVLPEESAECVFKFEDSKIKVNYGFINDKLYILTVSSDDQPSKARIGASNFEAAKEFLNKYQAVSNAAYFVEMQSMLDGIEPDKNTTKISGNIKLEIKYVRDITEFLWTYIENDVEVPIKSVALYFEQGFLKYFSDKWYIYKIGSNRMNLSEKEAIEIATNSARSFSWRAGSDGKNNKVEVTNFGITGVIVTKLNFENLNDPKMARGGDPVTLYPAWRVQLKLDDIYPGNIYALDVGIWADTKTVYDTQTMIWFDFVP